MGRRFKGLLGRMGRMKMGRDNGHWGVLKEDDCCSGRQRKERWEIREGKGI